MKDESFIRSTLQKGTEAKEKAGVQFSHLSSKQMNWKASADSWSIAQCLDHLIRSDSSYFPDFEKIAAGTFRMSFWEKASPFTGICGRIIKNRLQDEVGKKMIAPQKIRPSSEIEIEIIERYHKNLERFLGYISRFTNTDIDKTIITSPIIPIVTYSLRDALHFLVRHEHRHINQAIRVKANKNFGQ